MKKNKIRRPRRLNFGATETGPTLTDPPHAFWNGLPFPTQAERVVLPDGQVLEDAVIWPGFLQDELGLDAHAVWAELLALPAWPNDKSIPFREDGSDPHWIDGKHVALNYRGGAVKRGKIWCQADYASGLRRYGYTGWQHDISYATHAVESVPPVQRLAERLNVGLLRSGYVAHNHWIVTRYSDREDNIGLHSDKDHDFAENSFFVVIKFGAPREFAFQLAGKKEKPFLVRTLFAGTAIFVRCKAVGAANDIVKHGVPEMDTAVGLSGSIVSRCIRTLVPWDAVAKKIAASAKAKARARAAKAKKKSAKKESAS